MEVGHRQLGGGGHGQTRGRGHARSLGHIVENQNRGRGTGSCPARGSGCGPDHDLRHRHGPEPGLGRSHDHGRGRGQRDKEVEVRGGEVNDVFEMDAGPGRGPRSGHGGRPGHGPGRGRGPGRGHGRGQGSLPDLGSGSGLVRDHGSGHGRGRERGQTNEEVEELREEMDAGDEFIIGGVETEENEARILQRASVSDPAHGLSQGPGCGPLHGPGHGHRNGPGHGPERGSQHGRGPGHGHGRGSVPGSSSGSGLGHVRRGRGPGRGRREQEEELRGEIDDDMEENSDDQAIDGNEEDEDEYERPRMPPVVPMAPGNQYNRRQRIPLRDRPVCDMTSCLQPEKYVQMDFNGLQREEFEGVLVNKTKDTQEEKIIWRNFKTTRAGRQGRENVIRTPGGVIGEAKNARSALECFYLFMKPDLITEIVARTNLNITRFIQRATETQQRNIRVKNRWIKETTGNEFLAFLGLNYIRGLLQQNYWRARRCFGNEAGHPIFGATMSINRQAHFEIISDSHI